MSDTLTVDKRKDVWLVCGLTTFSLAIRMVAWHQSPLISRDGVNYICRGGVVADVTLPLAPYLTVLCRLAEDCGIAPEMLIVAVNLIAGSLLVAMVYLIARQCDLVWWSSAVAALLVSVNPLGVDVSHQVQREAVFMLFCAVVLFCFLAARDSVRRRGWLLLAGGAGAIAFFARVEAVEWLFFLGLALVWEAFQKRCPVRAVMDNGALFAGFLGIGFLLIWLLNISPSELSQFFCGKINVYFLRGWQ